MEQPNHGAHRSLRHSCQPTPQSTLEGRSPRTLRQAGPKKPSTLSHRLNPSLPPAPPSHPRKTTPSRCHQKTRARSVRQPARQATADRPASAQTPVVPTPGGTVALRIFFADDVKSAKGEPGHGESADDRRDIEMST